MLDLEPVAGGAPASLDISSIALPPRLRSGASVGVLDITEFFGDTTGGVRTYLLEKARYVQRHPELRQVLVVPGARDEILEAGGVRCYRLHGPPIPTQKPYRFMLATRSTARIVAHERPDLIEVGSAWCAPWLVHLATRGLKVPTVWFYHSNFPRIIAPRPHAAGWPRLAASALAWRYVRRLGRLVQATIAPTRAVVQELESAGVRNVVHVPLGVDLERFNPLRRVRADETRRRFGLPEGRLAMYVGRMAAEKDIDLLLSGWLEVERRTGARLVLVGAGPALRRLRRTRGGRRGFWLPYQRDRELLADLYAAVDLVVAPGSAETFGLAAMEGLASGVPVLSVDRGGVAESVTLSGAGRLYTSGDPAHLGEVAIELLGQDLTALGRLGRRYAEEHHGWDSVLNRLFETYRRVLAG
ncbi:MAG TPA: glycosyltransferase [Gemmatimonadales bacterium]|nr:glycosyltransferase [Gemmatimonadales bacterium]